MKQKLIRIISYLLLGVAFIILNGCLHLKTSEDRAVISQCTMSCEHRAQKCHKVCRNSCQQCHAYSKQYASESYLWYRHEQYVKCGIVAREVQSYRDPLKCRKSTCNCAADYQACVQSCGGIVSKQLRSTPVCD